MEERRGCKNGNPIGLYPHTFRGADRLGVNYRGMVEYKRGDVIYEMLYEVHNEVITELNRHNALGQTGRQHVENSEKRFGEWWCYDL